MKFFVFLIGIIAAAALGYFLEPQLRAYLVVEAPPEVVVEKPAPAPEPIPEPAPAPEPAPIPEPAPMVEAVPEGPVDIVALMKASISAAEIKEFTTEQVLEWNDAGALETIDGVEYQIGNISFKSETAFGLKTMHAKALIKDRKVARWIWAKTGLDIH
jgi:hypothetical protein